MNIKKQHQNTGKSKAMILVVDDHPIVRQGLVRLINQEEDLIVCGEAGDTYQAMKAIGRYSPDAVIVDISLKGTSGLELMKNIKTQYPKLPVLALSMHDESLYAERALRAGAMGYIMKHEAPEKVVTALRQVLDGELYVSERIAKKMLHRFVDGRMKQVDSIIEALSDRELEVFHLLGEGFGTRQIAEQLSLSIKTIESYREHIKEKLQLSSASELIQHAIQWVRSENIN